jgi:hypothetical protein
VERNFLRGEGKVERQKSDCVRKEEIALHFAEG